MGFFQSIIEKDITKRILVLLSLVIIFIFMKGMINLFLLTFLFTYLIYSMQNLVMRKLGKIIPLNYVIVTVVFYLVFATLITFFIYKYIPVVINQIINIIGEISDFDYMSNIHIQKYLVPVFEQIDVKGYTKGGVTFLLQLAANIGKWSINVFIALMLSMFFMLEKHKVVEFMHRFKESRISGFYKYLHYFGVNFLNSFGKVIQAQILIALTNSVLSVIGLGILGFKQLLGLGVMIFFFSLVPVAGTIASLVPLSIIAFNQGGIMKIVYVFIMIAALHALESYVLNPKFMASKTELPVFIIFIVLIVSEHFMKVWGLLLGIPMFMFFLDLLNVKQKE
ncbi:AI-2E family transporter [Clostridium sp. SYSU_GA19001]|uniref:AI-2E family transporter n=1 Tax=Clostridium caldaquaticum TaxID=2940653 RepID=UPI00207760BA|nr:AI-2E family transporter [Clostridium caldaquaticum]MCM8710232.1 AI-2E family transporter [Clostridium caldaquaticum]